MKSVMLIIIALLPLVQACPSQSPVILTSHRGDLVCGRPTCPNITCVGYLNPKEETCYTWTCLPSLHPRIPPPYTHIHLDPVSSGEVLANFLAFLLLAVLSPLFALGLALGGPEDEFDS